MSTTDVAAEKVDAWMPLWIGAYLADTMHLSRDSHGGYLLLLFAYWRNKGPLADDDEDLAGITKATPAEWKKLRLRLARFFTIEDGHWAHTRADKELASAGLRKASAVSKAKAGAEARWKDSHKRTSSNAPGMLGALLEVVPKQCPTPTPEEKEKEPPIAPKGAGYEPDGFRAFWEAWPKSNRKGGRDKCLSVWRDKRHEGAAEVILAHVVAMAATKDWTKEGGQYVPAPVVYLRSTAWTGAEVDAPHAQYAGAI